MSGADKKLGIHILLNKDNPYKVLGINNRPSLQEANVAFKKLALIFHPDKCSVDESIEIFQAINAAYASVKKELFRVEACYKTAVKSDWSCFLNNDVDEHFCKVSSPSFPSTNNNISHRSAIYPSNTRTFTASSTLSPPPSSRNLSSPPFTSTQSWRCVARPVVTSSTRRFISPLDSAASRDGWSSQRSKYRFYARQHTFTNDNSSSYTPAASHGSLQSDKEAKIKKKKRFSDASLANKVDLDFVYKKNELTPKYNISSTQSTLPHSTPTKVSEKEYAAYMTSLSPGNRAGEEVMEKAEEERGKGGGRGEEKEHEETTKKNGKRETGQGGNTDKRNGEILGQRKEENFDKEKCKMEEAKNEANEDHECTLSIDSSISIISLSSECPQNDPTSPKDMNHNSEIKHEDIYITDKPDDRKCTSARKPWHFNSKSRPYNNFRGKSSPPPSTICPSFSQEECLRNENERTCLVENEFPRRRRLIKRRRIIVSSSEAEKEEEEECNDDRYQDNHNDREYYKDRSVKRRNNIENEKIHRCNNDDDDDDGNNNNSNNETKLYGIIIADQNTPNPLKKINPLITSSSCSPFASSLSLTPTPTTLSSCCTSSHTTSPRPAASVCNSTPPSTASPIPVSKGSFSLPQVSHRPHHHVIFQPPHSPLAFSPSRRLVFDSSTHRSQASTSCASLIISPSSSSSSSISPSSPGSSCACLALRAAGFSPTPSSPGGFPPCSINSLPSRTRRLFFQGGDEVKIMGVNARDNIVGMSNEVKEQGRGREGQGGVRRKNEIERQKKDGGKEENEKECKNIPSKTWAQSHWDCIDLGVANASENEKEEKEGGAEETGKEGKGRDRVRNGKKASWSGWFQRAASGCETKVPFGLGGRMREQKEREREERGKSNWSEEIEEYDASGEDEDDDGDDDNSEVHDGSKDCNDSLYKDIDNLHDECGGLVIHRNRQNNLIYQEEKLLTKTRRKRLWCRMKLNSKEESSSSNDVGRLKVIGVERFTTGTSDGVEPELEGRSNCIIMSQKQIFGTAESNYGTGDSDYDMTNSDSISLSMPLCCISDPLVSSPSLHDNDQEGNSNSNISHPIANVWTTLLTEGDEASLSSARMTESEGAGEVGCEETATREDVTKEKGTEMEKEKESERETKDGGKRGKNQRHLSETINEVSDSSQEVVSSFNQRINSTFKKDQVRKQVLKTPEKKNFQSKMDSFFVRPKTRESKDIRQPLRTVVKNVLKYEKEVKRKI